jgi:hypothetical protein
MCKLVMQMHVSLDGFVAGPRGELESVKLDEELFEWNTQHTKNADTVICGSPSAVNRFTVFN